MGSSRAPTRKGRERKQTCIHLRKVTLTLPNSYQLASRLSERLDDMGKDLTGMIEEINDASSTLSKNNKANDPVSQRCHPSKLIIADQLPPHSFPKWFEYSTVILRSYSRLTKEQLLCN